MISGTNPLKPAVVLRAYCEYCYLYALRPNAVRCEVCSQPTRLRPAGYSKAGSTN